MDEYTIRGREIYSGRGKLVATLDDDGNPVMAPGMAGPHSAKVKAFLGGQGAERGADTAGGGNVPLRNVAPASLDGLDRNPRAGRAYCAEPILRAMPVDKVDRVDLVDNVTGHRSRAVLCRCPPRP